MTARRLLLCVAMVAIWSATPGAYLHFTTAVNGQTTHLVWKNTPVRWYATNTGAAGVSATAFQATVARAFDTWQSVPTASITFAFAGFTSAEPFDDDGLSVIGFQDAPDLDRVLGATGFVIDDVTGEIVESDIFFNSTFAWSTADAGQSGRFDLQSIATHEIGHFLGLAHSALGESERGATGGRRVLASGSVMFPVAFGTGNVADRQLQPDDIAAVSDLYPDGNFRRQTGTIRGRVLMGGRPLLGAHVVTFHLASGELIAGFTLNEQGEFQISGLKPGAHLIRVEPLDDADTDSFFEDETIDIGFQPSFHSRIVAAPAGGQSPTIDIIVTPR